MSACGYRFALRPVALASPALDSWLDLARRAHVNGGVFVASFACDPVPSLMRSKLEALEFVSTLLNHPALREALPGVIPSVGATLDELPDLEPSFVFHIDGDLTGLIHYGGAYWRPELPAAASKRIAGDVVRELFGDRWDDLEYANTHAAWSKWFRNVAWDATLLIIDRGRSSVTLIVATDTD